MIRFLIFLLALPSLALAQERTFGNGTLPEYLAIYDADNSGALSEEELQTLRDDRQQRQQRLKNRWDLDRNGKISDREREIAKLRIRFMIEQRRLRRFTEVDLDDDGQLTTREFLRIAAVLAAESDNPGLALRIFINLDGDNSGTVSQSEFLLKLDTLPTDPVDGDNMSPHPKTPLPPAPTPAPKPRKP